MIDWGNEGRNEDEEIMLQCFSKVNLTLRRVCFKRLKMNSSNKASNKIICLVIRKELSRLLIARDRLKLDEKEASGRHSGRSSVCYEIKTDKLMKSDSMS